jgi:predicted dehydrogenase
MLRVGVIGYGGRIHGVITTMREIEPDLRVVAVIDPDEPGARERLADCDKQDVTFYKKLDPMMRKEKLDGLLIGTRCNLHTPYAIEAAKYDIPLFLEKPVAINMRQTRALERAYEKSRCPVVVSFPLRVAPLFTLAREYIEKGEVGTPIHIAAVNYVNYGTVYWQEGYRNFDITQGLFLQKATHDFDYMSYLMDSPIVRVAAMGQFGKVFGGKERAGLTCSKCKKTDTCLESPQNRKRNGSGGGLDDHLCLFGKDCGSPETGTNEDCSNALVEFASGAQGVYTQVFYARRDAGTRGATVSGYMGTVSFDLYKDELRRVRHHAPISGVESAGGVEGHAGGDSELARDFIGLIHGKIKESRAPIATGLRSVYACLAANESMKKGKFVNVRQVGA